MSKGNSKGGEVDFGNLDLDSSLDIPGFSDDGFNMSDDRKPVSMFRDSFTSTMKAKATDRTTINRLIGISLPKGYSQAFNAYDGITKGIGDIYRENQSELAPHLRKVGRALEKNTPRIWGMMPRGVKELFKEERHTDTSEGPSELDQNLEEINKFFEFSKENAKADKIAAANKDLLDKKRFELQAQGVEEQARLLNRLVSYQDTILINYHRKSLEIGYRQYDVALKGLVEGRAYQTKSLELLAAIGKNSALPDYVKMNTEEALKNSLRQKLADAVSGGVGGYASNFFPGMKKRAGEVIQGAMSGISMAGAMGMGGEGGMSKAQTAGMALGTGVAELTAAKLTPIFEWMAASAADKTSKTGKIARGGNFLRELFTAVPEKINAWSQSTTEAEGLKGQFIDLAKSMVDRYDPSTRINGMGIEALGDAAVFDNLFHKSVTEIIPAYMASMDKSLRELATGEPQEENAYSHYTGGMVSRSTLNKQHIRIGIKRSQGDVFRNEVDGLMRDMGAGELTPVAKRALRNRLLVDLQSGLPFNPGDYVKTDSWTNIDESVADELIEFFSDQFGIDPDGKFNGDEVTRSFKNDIVQSFSDTAKRLPNVRERTVALASTVMGRRALREMGLSRYDGVEGDVFNTENFNAMLLGDGDLDDELHTSEVNNKLSDFDLNDAVGSIKRRSEEKKEIAKQQALAELERVRRLEEAGELDDIDVTSRGSRPSSKPFTFKWVTQTPTTEQVTQTEVRETRHKGGNGRLRDMGTHQRLDTIIQILRSQSGTALPPSVSNTGPDRFATARKRAGAIKDKVVSSVKERYNQAEAYLKEHPYVKQGMAEIEKLHGKITDPELRTAILEAIYNRTGTIDEISEKVTAWYHKYKDKALASRDQAMDWIKDKTSPAAIEEYKSQGRDLRKRGLDFFETHAGADARRGYADSAREGYSRFKERLSTGYAQTKESASEFFSSLRANTEGMFEGDEIAVKDQELIELVRELREIGIAQGSIMESTLEGGGGETMFGKAGSIVGKGGKIAGKLGLWTAKMYGKATIGAAKLGWGGIKLGAGGIAKGAKGLVSSRDGLGVTDVFLQGSQEPVLKAADIRRGFYKDVESDKIITGFSDITGAVIDIRTNEFVITSDDFSKGLYKANGESILGYAARKGGKALGWMGKMGLAYTTGSYGLIWKAAKLLGGIAVDQFTQFDAYFPGDTEPRISSKKMAKGYYRDVNGEAIMSLKDIKGAVYDINDNEVISEEDWKTYKSLYTRNGSVLFTVGRGVAGVGSFLGKGAAKLGLSYAKKVGKAYLWGAKKLLGGAKAIGTKVGKGLSTLWSRLRGKEGASRTVTRGAELTSDELAAATFDIQSEQLQVQHAILHLMSQSDKVKGDLDGDGIVENSWADIQRRRKARNAGGNGDVVEAINALKNSLAGRDGKGGDKDDEKSSSLMDKFSGIKDFFGGRKGGLMGKVGGLLGKGGKYLGMGALGAGKFLGGKVLLPGLALAGKGALAAASAIGGVISAPVLLGAAAVAGIAYVGYRMYQNAKIDEKPLYHLRMSQYGVNPKDGERVDKILALEALLRTGIRDNGGDSVSIDGSAIDLTKVEPLFGFEPVSPDDTEELITRRKQLYVWIGRRFKPVYLAHVRASMKLTNTSDLSTMDDKIKGEQLKEAVSIVNLPGMTKYYDQLDWSPFPDALTEDDGDVNDIIDRIHKLAKKAKEDPQSVIAPKDDPAQVGKVVLGVSMDGNSDVKDITEELVREAKFSKTGRALAGTSATGFLNQMPATQSKKALNLANATRYHIYGLDELTAEKVSDLYAIEELFWEKLEFDGTNMVVLGGNMTENLEKVHAVLKGVGVHHKAQIDLWFKYRFLPAFYQYALGMRRNYNGDIKEAHTKVSGETLKAVLRKMSEVLVEVDGTVMDVWSVAFSPWEGYTTASDPGVIQKYLKSIKTSPPPPLTVDGLNEAMAKDNQTPKSYQQKMQDLAAGAPTNKQGITTPGTSVFQQHAAKVAGTGYTGAALLSSGKTVGNSVPTPGGGSGGDITLLPESRGDGAAANRELIEAAAKMVGFDPSIAMTIAGIESTWRPHVGASSSSAKGLYQFTTGTWNEMIDKYGHLYGIKRGHSPLDPKANAVMGMHYLKDGYRSLKGKLPGKEITDLSLYMAHFLGHGGAARWLSNSDQALASQAVSEAALKANPGIFTDKGRILTVAEVNMKLEQRMKAIRKSAGIGSGASPVALTGTNAPEIESPASPTGGMADLEEMDNVPLGMDAGGLLLARNVTTQEAPSTVGERMPTVTPVKAEDRKAKAAPAPSTTTSMVMDKQASEAKRASTELAPIESILSNQLEELRTSNRHLEDIKSLLDRMGVPSNQPAPQGKVIPAIPRGTTSNRRNNAIT